MKSLYDSLNLPNPDTPDVVPEETFNEHITGKDFARAIVLSPEFRQYLRNGVVLGDLPHSMAVRLMDLAFGKPVEHVEVTNPQRPHQHVPLETLRQQLLDELALIDQLRMNDEVDPPSPDQDDGSPPSSIH